MLNMWYSDLLVHKHIKILTLTDLLGDAFLLDFFDDSTLFLGFWDDPWLFLGFFIEFDCLDWSVSSDNNEFSDAKVLFLETSFSIKSFFLQIKES